MAAMFETLVEAFVYARAAYAGLGLVFAVLFVWVGVQRLNSEAGIAFVDWVWSLCCLSGTLRGLNVEPILRRSIAAMEMVSRVTAAGFIPTSQLIAFRERRRNYFSPDEISAFEGRLQQQPHLFLYWSRRVLMNLQEIQAGPK